MIKHDLRKAINQHGGDVWAQISCLETLTDMAIQTNTISMALEIADDYLPIASRVLYAVINNPISTKTQKQKAERLLREKEKSEMMWYFERDINSEWGQKLNRIFNEDYFGAPEEWVKEWSEGKDE